MDDLQSSILSDINGASVETIGTIIENEIGIEDKKITFYKLNRNVNLILNECAEKNNSSIDVHAIKFEDEFKKQEGFIYDAVGKGAGFLGKVAISGEQIKRLRDIFKPAHKFKPWGAIKLGEKVTKILNKAGVALAVILEAWDIWIAYKNKKALGNIKNSLKEAINGYFSEISNLFSDNETYFKNFAPGFIELKRQLEQREKDLVEIENKRLQLDSFKQKLSNWCKGTIEDADFEELI